MTDSDALEFQDPTLSILFYFGANGKYVWKYNEEDRALFDLDCKAILSNNEEDMTFSDLDCNFFPSNNYKD